MNEVKPGISTSEFWLVIVNTVLMVLAAFKLLDQSEVDQLKALLAPFIGALVPIALYVWGRVKVKTS